MIAHCDLYECRRILHIEFGQHILAVGIDGSDIQEQLHGDLMIREALSYKFQYLLFTLGQHGQQLVIGYFFL